MSHEPSEEPEDLDRPPAFFPYDPDSDMDDEEPVDFGEPVQVEVEAVFAAQAGQDIQRFVLLSDGRRKVPIVIGAFEAQAISLPLENAQPDRPLTHDLCKAMLERTGWRIEKIVIDDLWGNTYYAKITMKRKDEEVTIDSRPSDAIALAVRFGCPIYVAEGILDRGE